MSVEYLLMIKGEKQGVFHGESIDNVDHIIIEGWSWGAKAPYDIATGHQSAKRQLEPFHFEMKMSSASPQIFTALATAETLDTVEFTLRKAAAPQNPYCKFTLTNARIVNYHTGGEVKDHVFPNEQFSLVYQSLEFEFTPLDENDSPTSPIVASDNWGTD